MYHLKERENRNHRRYFLYLSKIHTQRKSFTPSQQISIYIHINVHLQGFCVYVFIEIKCAYFFKKKKEWQAATKSQKEDRVCCQETWFKSQLCHLLGVRHILSRTSERAKMLVFTKEHFTNVERLLYAPTERLTPNYSAMVNIFLIPCSEYDGFIPPRNSPFMYSINKYLSSTYWFKHWEYSSE